MSGLVFACCSAGRPQMLVDKTLRTLVRANYTGILWLVVPHAEVVAYQTAVSGHAITCMIVPCEKGLTKQRRHFRSTMLPGTEIVFIDDDVEAIKIRLPHGMSHVTNITLLANHVFQEMHNADALLAGVYPMCNYDWMKPTVSRRNAYVVGALYFCINDDRLVEPEESEMEDWDRCLAETAADRPVLRFNWVGIQTKYWGNAGGLQDTDRDAARAGVIDALATKYDFVKKFVRRNGKPDIKFRSHPVQWLQATPPQNEGSAPSAPQ